MRRAAGGALVPGALFLARSISCLAALGSRLHEDVLLDYTSANLRSALGSGGAAAALAATVRLAYLAALLTAFPLQMAPLRNSAKWLLHADESYQSLRAPELSGRSFYLVSYGALAATFGVAGEPGGGGGGGGHTFLVQLRLLCAPAAVCVHNLASLLMPLPHAVVAPGVYLLLQLADSTTFAAMCFFLPGLLRCSLERWLPMRVVAAAAMLLAVGAAQSVAGLPSAVLAQRSG